MRPAIIAHRGFSAGNRENGPTAWRAAIEARVDGIETDIRRTSDGVLVCCHDADLMRIAGDPRKIVECDWPALSAIQAGGEPAAPLFEELLKLLPDDVLLLMDIKDERPETLEAIVGLVTELRPNGRIMAGLHARDSVVAMRGLAGFDILGFFDDPDSHGAFFAAGGTVFRLWEAQATPDRLAQLSNEGRPVWIMTGGPSTGRPIGIFDDAVLRALTRQGCAGFLVDDPVGCRQILEGVAA